MLFTELYKDKIIYENLSRMAGHYDGKEVSYNPKDVAVIGVSASPKAPNNRNEDLVWVIDLRSAQRDGKLSEIQRYIPQIKAAGGLQQFRERGYTLPKHLRDYIRSYKKTGMAGMRYAGFVTPSGFSRYPDIDQEPAVEQPPQDQDPSLPKRPQRPQQTKQLDTGQEPKQSDVEEPEADEEPPEDELDKLQGEWIDLENPVILDASDYLNSLRDEGISYAVAEDIEGIENIFDTIDNWVKISPRATESSKVRAESIKEELSNILLG